MACYSAPFSVHWEAELLEEYHSCQLKRDNTSTAETYQISMPKIPVSNLKLSIIWRGWRKRISCGSWWFNARIEEKKSDQCSHCAYSSAKSPFKYKVGPWLICLSASSTCLEPIICCKNYTGNLRSWFQNCSNRHRPKAGAIVMLVCSYTPHLFPLAMLV